MTNDIAVGFDGTFDFEIDFPRILADDESFSGEWLGPRVRGVESKARVLSHEPLPNGRYRLIGEILLPSAPGSYENTVSEVRDALGNTLEQVRPRFPSLIAPGFVGSESQFER